MNFNERRLALIKAGEGNISHMYLDSKGLVTVGVGQMIPEADEATKLSFVERGTAARASDWTGCSRECHRRGISDHRNEEVKHLFESAARGDT
jgi:GH24 family phage-related lysozyme (muramidase)